jgi:hypothetical protein
MSTQMGEGVNRGLFWIEILLTYIFLIFKILNDVTFINFILGNPFHTNLKNLLMEFLINHMFKDNYKLAY